MVVKSQNGSVIPVLIDLSLRLYEPVLDLVDSE